MSGAELRIRGTTYPPDRALLVCASPRVGSTLVCDELARTGVLGYPKEYFFPASEQACATAWGLRDPELEPAAYRRAVLRDGTSPNRLFAAKIMWSQLPHMTRRLGHSPGQTSTAIREGFPLPSALVLSRRDRVAAAVSEHRAELTGLWSRAAGSPSRSPAVEDFDLHRVAELHDLQHRADQGWPTLLSQAGVTYRHHYYEDWQPDPFSVATDAGTMFGMELARPVGPVSSLRPQRDETNTLVAARFRETGRGCPTCSCPSPAS